MTADEAQRRAVRALHDDWFRHEELRPTFMWLVELAPAPAHGDLLNPLGPVRRAFVFTAFGGQERPAWAWRRFATVHFARPWDQAGEWRRVPSLGLLLPEQHVYEVGWALYGRDPSDDAWRVDLVFGPKCGRGYRLLTDGTSTSVWMS